MALSLDIRKRIIAAWQAGQSTRQLAARFDVSERTVRTLK
ncbi:MAG: helix-turn-helix domain-containing protein [Phycisphaeraceae bacterium JB051]